MLKVLDIWTDKMKNYQVKVLTYQVVVMVNKGICKSTIILLKNVSKKWLLTIERKDLDNPSYCSLKIKLINKIRIIILKKTMDNLDQLIYHIIKTHGLNNRFLRARFNFLMPLDCCVNHNLLINHKNRFLMIIKKS